MGGCDTIICNQENFLLKNNEYMAKNILPGHHVLFKPASKDGLDGRPTNGMFIAVPLCLKEKMKNVVYKSNRIQGVIIKDEHLNMLIINTYFPTDPRNDQFDETNLLLLLSEIEKSIEESGCTHVLWTGDINADFRRNTRFVRTIDEFISNMNLTKSWDRFSADFTHVTERDSVTHTSIIDHFFWNDTLNISDAGVIHLPENMSDHCPVFCKFSIPVENIEVTRNTDDIYNSFPLWSKLTEEERSRYKEEVQWKLKKINIPLHLLECRNVHCKDNRHREDIDELMLAVVTTMEDSAMKNIKSRKKKKTRIPEWSDDVEPLRENAHFWNAIWISAGKPMNCQLHHIMKKTRNRYHLLIRKKKRLLDRLKRDEMLTCCLKNDASIFDIIKRKRRCVHTIPSSIDGITSDIPGYLASKYENLYNAVDDEQNLVELEDSMEGEISQQDLTFVKRIDSHEMKRCAKKLKSGKKDPVLTMTSDFLINAPDILFQILSLCMRSCIIHSHISDFLLTSMLVPLIKDKLGDISSSNNYRSIAISSLIMKLFDLVIISQFKEFLYFDDLQFAYQTGVSTSMCTWLATESISYFQRNGSDVFTCLMDMTKAFDTVQHSSLFRKMLSQGMPPIIVRFVLVTYRNQRANVKWDNEMSEFFSIKNGVKQGAILSAVLYCVYTNGLFEELRRSKIGCYIGNTYVGVIGYADDLFLLSPTIDGLQEMLIICENYAKTHNLKFSTDSNPSKSKTKCMAFMKKERELRRLTLCGNLLPWVSTGKHLGMRIDNTKNIFNRDIMEKRARYINGNNQLMQEFSYASCMTKIFINRVYNSHQYGSVLWDLFGKQANMERTWSVSVRNMLRLDR